MLERDFLAPTKEYIQKKLVTYRPGMFSPIVQPNWARKLGLLRIVFICTNQI